MKKELKKSMKASTNVVRYFTSELVTYTIPIDFGNGVKGACTYSCS